MTDLIHVGATTLFAIYAVIVVVVPYVIWKVRRIGAAVPLGIVQFVVALMASPLCLGGYFRAPPPALFDSIGWMAVMFFLFVAGGHAGLDKKFVVRPGLLAIAVASLVVPFGAGILLGQWLKGAYPSFLGANGQGIVFNLAVGICIAVTALPMLAVLVRDLDLSSSLVGRSAMAVAVVHDIALWILLALVLVVARSASVHAGRVFFMLLLMLSFAALLVFVVRPLMTFLWERSAKSDQSALVGCCGLLLGCAAISDAIGFHLAIGAFLAGVSTPPEMFRRAAAVIDPISAIVLFPFFFLATALTIPGDIDFLRSFGAAAVVTIVALSAKFVSGALSARLSGFPPEDSLVLGSLLQCKGLMEIVAVVVLRDAGVVTADFAASFIMMSLATTLVAKPLVACSRALFWRKLSPV